MNKKQLQRLIKAHRTQCKAAQRRIENYVSTHGTEQQKAHFLDAITSPNN